MSKVFVNDVLKWLTNLGDDREIGSISIEELRELSRILVEIQKPIKITVKKRPKHKRKTGKRYPKGCKSWKARDEKLLFVYRTAGKSWKEISKELGRTAHACRIRHDRVKRGSIEPAR